jgi:hypothetical protein
MEDGRIWKKENPRVLTVFGKLETKKAEISVMKRPPKDSKILTEF